MKKPFLLLIGLVCAIKLFSQSPGDVLFDNTYVHNLEIISNQPQGALVAALENQRIADRQAATSITDINWTYTNVKVKLDGNLVDSVGIRTKCGDVSCSQMKPSLKIDFNEFVSGKKYDGLKKVNIDNCLHDSSFMREILNYDLLNSLGACSRRTAFVNVIIDGQSYGTYVYIEQVNKGFLKRYFNNKDGNLFKFNGFGDLSHSNVNSTSYRQTVDLKTNKTNNDWSDLQLLLDKVNNTPLTQYEDTIHKYLNVDAILKYLAVLTYTISSDNLFDAGNNGYYYHNTLTNKFEIIPHDYDFSFQSTTSVGSYSYNATNTGLINPVNNTAYFAKILAIPKYKNHYYDLCCYLKDHLGNKDSLKRRIDFYKNILSAASITPHSNCDFIPWSDPSNPFISGIVFEGLKDFAEKRYAKFDAEITALNHQCNLSIGMENLKNKVTCTIYPNPAQNYIYFSTKKQYKGKIEGGVYNTLGEKLIVLKDGQAKVNIAHLPKGLYLISLKTKEGISVGQKFLKE